jgi:hypothetical protein
MVRKTMWKALFALIALFALAAPAPSAPAPLERATTFAGSTARATPSGRSRESAASRGGP